MRWDALFADLEAQLSAQQVAEERAGVAELVRAEVAQVALADRLRAHRRGSLRVRLVDGATVAGTLLDAGPDWLLVDVDLGVDLDVHRGADRDADRGGPRGGVPAEPEQALVPLAAVVAVSGLSRAVAPPAGVVERRLRLASALRALAGRRAVVRVDLLAVAEPGGAGRQRLTGTIDRVGSDHLDLAVHPLDEPRRARAVREVLVVPFTALTTVRGASPASATMVR